MRNRNLLLKRKLKRDPLSKDDVVGFLENYVYDIIRDSKTDYLGEIKYFPDPQLTWVSFYYFHSGKIPKNCFEIKINQQKHKNFMYFHEEGLDLFIGSTLIHEISHPKYHFWAVRDEINSEGSPGIWHRLVDNEAKRFTSQNPSFVTSLVRKYDLI